MVTRKEIQLISRRGVLRLTVGEREWTSVVLQAEGTERVLGAEKVGYVSKRLRDFLEHAADDDFKWILSLSEAHVRIYGKLTPDGLTLRFYDRKAVHFADLLISDEEREKWLATLATLETPIMN
jgi:hypothetical protein